MEENNRSQKHSETVNKIVTLLGARGPTLPIHIASETGLSMIFSNAFLSELIGKKLVKTSSMRIGSSPLYYLPGQEEQLLKFIEYIKGKERDAVDLIMKEEVIRDEYLEPAIRVAMRGIKDFASPIQANLEGKSTIFWRFFKIPDLEAKERIREMLEPKKSSQRAASEDSKILSQEKKVEETIVKEIASTPSVTSKKQENSRSFESPITSNRIKDGASSEKTIDKNNQELLDELKSELEKSKIAIIRVIESKKKEAVIVVEINTEIGKMEFLAIYKEKKKVNETDLALALGKAQNERLPCLFLSDGDINKKGLEYLQVWKNLIKYKKISLQKLS